MQKETTTYDLTNGSGKNMASSSDLGAYVGIGYKLRLSERFNFTPELNYSMISYKDEASKKATIKFLSVPLMFESAVTDKLKIELGPQVDYYLTDFHRDGDLVKRLQLGMGIGASYNLFDKFYIEARFTVGLPDKSKSPDGAAISKFSRNTLQVGVSYRF